ncbi:hypothetical protein MMC22_002177 [Lobaria immixta]|nr:hypothetical protein [Lobaria immixta]
MAAIQEDSINARNLSMLQSGKHSDMTICCEGVSLYVHQAIVCSASEFFASAYHGDFKEAHTGVIFLEDQLEIVKMMLLYFYTLDYDEQVPSFDNYKIRGSQTVGGPRAGVVVKEEMAPKAALEDTRVRMTKNARVYGMADKYIIPGLKELAKTKFKTLSSSAGLILDHPSIIDEVYDTTPSEDRGLRDIVTNLCAPHVQKIVRGNRWSTTAQMHVEFTFDLLRVSAATLQVTQNKLQWTEEALQVADEYIYSTETQFKPIEVLKPDWKVRQEERNAKAGR